MGKRVSAIVSAALAGMLATGAAGAQTVQDWDTDADARINLDEWQTGFQASGWFQQWDTGADATLNADEFAAGLFSLWDADGNGEVSQEEFLANAPLWFGEESDVETNDITTWDNDASGGLTPEEFSAGIAEISLFAAADADGDGVLSQDEFGARLFTAADVNKDDLIDEQEDDVPDGWFE